MDFATMMQLEDQGGDVFLARGPQYPWGGLYGGQIIAQGLRAGAATVDERFHVHSLHAYFIRRGNADEPISLEVTRSRDGRSFVTRSVVCRQEVGVILTMSLSFHVDEAGHDVQTARLPDIPGPDEVAGYTWSTMFDRRFAQLRNAEEGKGVAWMRMKDPVGNDPILQACAVAYLSDDLPTDAVVALHPDRPAPGEGDAFGCRRLSRRDSADGHRAGVAARRARDRASRSPMDQTPRLTAASSGRVSPRSAPAASPGIGRANQ